MGLSEDPEFCVSKWFGLDNKNGFKHEDNSLKQLTLTAHGLTLGRVYYRKDIQFASEIWGAYLREGLLSEGYLPLRFGGLIFGRAYYRKDFCV